MAYPDACVKEPCPHVLRATSGKAESLDCSSCGGTWPTERDAYRPGGPPRRPQGGRAGGARGGAEPARSAGTGENAAGRGPHLPQDAPQGSG